MKTTGIYLMIGGLGSFLLNLIGYEFSLLMWIDMWGLTVGYAIRIAAIVIGAVLFFLGKNKESMEPESVAETEV